MFGTHQNSRLPQRSRWQQSGASGWEKVPGRGQGHAAGLGFCVKKEPSTHIFSLAPLAMRTKQQSLPL